MWVSIRCTFSLRQLIGLNIHAPTWFRCRKCCIFCLWRDFINKGSWVYYVGAFEYCPLHRCNHLVQSYDVRQIRNTSSGEEAQMVRGRNMPVGAAEISSLQSLLGISADRRSLIGVEILGSCKYPVLSLFKFADCDLPRSPVLETFFKSSVGRDWLRWNGT